MSSPIKKGDFIIPSHTDRPCVKLVARVVKVDGDAICARYITVGPYLSRCWARLEKVTRVTDFGVTLTLRGGRVWAEITGDSVIIATP